MDETVNVSLTESQLHFLISAVKLSYNADPYEAERLVQLLEERLEHFPHEKPHLPSPRA